MNLDTLLQRPDVWRAGQVSAAVKAVSSGFAELDAQLAGGGWPRGALTELIMPRQGIGACNWLPKPAMRSVSCSVPGAICNARHRQHCASSWSPESAVACQPLSAVCPVARSAGQFHPVWRPGRTAEKSA